MLETRNDRFPVTCEYQVLFNLAVIFKNSNGYLYHKRHHEKRHIKISIRKTEAHH